MNKKKIKNKKGGSTFFDKLTKAITESFNNTGVSGPIEPSEHETTPDNQINIDMNGKEAVIELQKPFYSDVTQIARSEEDITNQTDSSAAATVAINKESKNKINDAINVLAGVAKNSIVGNGKKKFKKSISRKKNKGLKCRYNCKGKFKSNGKSKTNKL